MALTSSMEDYLEAVLILHQKHGTTEKEINLVFGLFLPIKSEKQSAISAGRLPAWR